MMEEIIISVDGSQNVDQKYHAPGVWALWGISVSSGIEHCLEVGQSWDMLKEIYEDIEMLSGQDNIICSRCKNIYPASQRYRYSASFNVHKCKNCPMRPFNKLRNTYAKLNPRRVDKYRDIAQMYHSLRFVLVPYSFGQKSKSERLRIEQTYAEKHRALYWYA